MIYRSKVVLVSCVYAECCVWYLPLSFWTSGTWVPKLFLNRSSTVTFFLLASVVSISYVRRYFWSLHFHFFTHPLLLVRFVLLQAPPTREPYVTFLKNTLPISLQLLMNALLDHGLAGHPIRYYQQSCLTSKIQQEDKVISKHMK